jgi:hypothetical protein
MNNCCICWFFTRVLKKMHGSRSKIPSKTSPQAALRGGFNSGVKGLSGLRLGSNYILHFCDKTPNFPKDSNFREQPTSTPVQLQPTDITRTQYTRCSFAGPPEDEQVMLKTYRALNSY